MVEIASTYCCGIRSSRRRIAAWERSRATLLTSSEWVRRVRTESCGSSGKTWVLSWSLEFLLGQLMYFAGSVLHLAETMRHLYGPAVYILATAIYVVLLPIYPIALTLFYYDQRIRHEGYDIEQMMDAAGLNPATNPTAAEGPVAPAATEEEQA